MVIILIFVGMAAKKTGMLSEDADACILKLLVNILLPCFIFAKIIGNEQLQDPENMIFAPLAGFLGVTIPVLFSLFLSKYVFKKVIPDQKAQRTFALSAGLQNYGYIAIPVLEKEFGEGLTGMMLLHNTGVDLAIWSVGLMVLSGEIDKNSWKKIFNAPFIAVLIASFFNWFKFDSFIPKVVQESYSTAGDAFIPIGIILVGSTCFTLISKSGFFKDLITVGKWNVLLGNLLRSGLIPLVVIGMAMVFPYSTELKKVIIIEAAMPAAFFPIVLARHYNGRPDVALHITLTSTALGLLLIPLWVAIGRSLLGI